MKTYLICVLNWGLGHATRSIPIINNLLARKNKVIIASDGLALNFLQKEYPKLQLTTLPAYNIQYPSFGSMFWSLLKQTPRLLKTIKEERNAVEQFVLLNGVDVIISDNRYGCHSSYTYNILLTHQINIPLPQNYKWFLPLVKKQNHHYFKRFDEIWIPDFPDRLLTGEMSNTENLKTPALFVGPLSRLSFKKSAQKDFILIVLSGPEPQRELLEQKFFNQAKFVEEQIVLVRGTTSPLKRDVPANIEIIDLAQSNEMNGLLLKAKHIICRSGYSSIMDLITLKKTAYLIPTPGQTEQEQLANHLGEKEIFLTCPQTLFNLTNAINAINTFEANKIDRVDLFESSTERLLKQMNRVETI